MKSMLDGTQILEFGEYVSALACTRLLAEVGAEVIKIEFTPDGDGAQGYRR